MSYLLEAKKLFDEIKAVRRQIHMNPEVGFDLPETVKTITQKLDEYQITYQRLGDSYAIVGTLGDAKKGKTLLLRADMDALAIKEKSIHRYTSKNVNGHLCGHDMHASTLLLALKILKDHENELNGQIKFLFQPAEETLNGGKLMLELGVLDNPKVDAGMALHMWPSGEDLGIYIQKGPALSSALNFEITIKGVGSHGAMPYAGVDPVFCASQIINACNGILARELPSNKGASLSMGYVNAIGGSVNVIPDTVVLRGTSRSLYQESAQLMAKRLPEIVYHIGQAFRCETEFKVLANVPALVNTVEMAELVENSARKVLTDDYTVKIVEPILASEDYAHIADKLNETIYFFVSCPLADMNNKTYPVHHPLVQFNEEALIIGSSTLVQSAIDWLNQNKA